MLHKDSLFACGTNGTIIKTTDGGQTWQNISLSVNTDVNDIHFFDAQNGIVVSTDSQLYKTTDGGAGWSAVASGITDPLFSLDFFNGSGIVGCLSQSIITSADSGASWNVAQSGFFGGGFYDAQMLDENIGFFRR